MKRKLIVSAVAASITLCAGGAVAQTDASQTPDSSISTKPATVASVKQVGLNDAQLAEANARMDLAKTLIARVEPDAKANHLSEGWKGDAMRMLLALHSEQLKALASNPSSMTSAGLVGAAKKAAVKDVGAGAQEKALGDLTQDLVFYPITPCRNADTRNAGGPIAGGTFRNFNADLGGSQGGTAGCFVVPTIDASAWAMNITVIDMTTTGFVAVRSVGSSALTSLVNYTGPGQQVNNFVIVNNSRVSSAEYQVYAATTVNVIIDLFGYFLPPNATALDCTLASSATVSVPVNAWTNIDATCPAGYSATGGGYNTPEGTLGYPGVWITSLPVSSATWRVWVDNQTNGNRSIQSWAQCCRTRGR